MKQTLLLLMAFIFTGLSAFADEDTRKDPELSFYSSSVGILAGTALEAPLRNPHGLMPIVYTSSDKSICQVDESGKISTALVEATTVVTVTASFAGNDEYRPGTATLEVGIIPRSPLKTPEMTPMGGTFDHAVEVQVTTDDAAATEIWYSTVAKSAEEFKNSDTNTSYMITGQTGTIRIDRSCKLYVMTRGRGTKSPVIEADFTISMPLKADFTTDKSVMADYAQYFESSKDLADWTVPSEWHIDDMKFDEVRDGDKKSIAITYAAGDGAAPLTSPVFDIKEGQRLEFYAYFKTKNLNWAPWTIDVTDFTTGQTTTLFNIYRWTLENNFVSDDIMQWKKIDIDLAAYAGHKVQIVLNYNFDGENLAIDAFRLVRDNPEAATRITASVDEPITFISRCQGEPTKTIWTLPGSENNEYAGNSVTVTYPKEGIYDVTLTISRKSEKDVKEIKQFVEIIGKAPTSAFAITSDTYTTAADMAFVPAGVPVQFADKSEGAPTSWEWKFTSDSETLTSTEQNPTVTFTKEGRYDVTLTTTNAIGSNQAYKAECLQVGGEMMIWNITEQEIDNLKPISYDSFGFYAGSNMFGLDRFAEKYPAPLADATVKTVDAYFASTKTREPDAAVELAIYDMAADGGPGKVLAKTSLKASELKSNASEYVQTTFEFAEPVALAKGKPFFVAIGPFPYQGVSSYEDQIALYCVTRKQGGLCATWDLAQYSDRWIANVSGYCSMAMGPVVNYTSVANGIDNTVAPGTTKHEIKAIYNLCGQQVTTPESHQIYIVRYSDGTSRKIMWK